MGALQAVDHGAVANRYEQAEIISTIKQTVAKGATDAQLKMFLEVCKSTGLDPFLKEIWFVAEKSIIMAGRDGYLRVANENPNFDGIETRVERDERNIPIKAVCTVWRKDRNHPTICEAYYSEYKKGSPVWSQYPSAMISKVAEVLALKRSFAINGCVTEEEIGGEERGSKEAAQAVAQEKIAAFRKELPPPATVDAVPGTPSEIEQQLHASVEQANEETAKSIDFKRMMEGFGAIKEEFIKLDSKATYYRILGQHGFEKSNEIRPLKLARQIYKEMAQALIEVRTSVTQADADVVLGAVAREDVRGDFR